jgi:hypothetical protein
MTVDEAFEYLKPHRQALADKEQCESLIRQAELDAFAPDADRPRLEKRLRALKAAFIFAERRRHLAWEALRAAAREAGILHPRAPGVW